MDPTNATIHISRCPRSGSHLTRRRRRGGSSNPLCRIQRSSRYPLHQEVGFIPSLPELLTHLFFLISIQPLPSTLLRILPSPPSLHNSPPFQKSLNLPINSLQPPFKRRSSLQFPVSPP